MTKGKPSILLIDDVENLLEEMRENLAKLISEDEVEVKTWQPTDTNANPFNTFENLIDDDTVLVITDYDLTSKGVTGLFGPSIVGWCQARSLPVGDFSRGNATTLPKEPNLFELRVPTFAVEAAKFTASTFLGFKQLRDVIDTYESDMRSPAAVLASLLGRPHLESQFSLYMSRLGSANSSLLERIRSFSSLERAPEKNEMTRLLAYVLGHVLLNAILKYPGPILSESALCAYLATTFDEIDMIAPLFADSAYEGPFSVGSRYFWRESVDETLDKMGETIGDKEFETVGNFNRQAVENAIGRPLATHECPRCGGHNGGFLCPFTQRAVCHRPDCSVPASNWIPQGAQLSRVERDFYDEWSPLLGI